MTETFLVCEGERNSLDERLLNAIIAQHYGLMIRIVSGGGGAQTKAVRAYLETLDSGNVAYLVRDRDYGPLSTAQQS